MDRSGEGSTLAIEMHESRETWLDDSHTSLTFYVALFSRSGGLLVFSVLDSTPFFASCQPTNLENANGHDDDVSPAMTDTDIHALEAGRQSESLRVHMIARGKAPT